MSRPLISIDSHHDVPLELAAELPAKYRAYLPRLEEREDGTYLVRPQHSAANQTSPSDVTPLDVDGSGDASAVDAVTRALAAGVKVDPSDVRSLRQTAAGNCAPAAFPGYTPKERLVEMARDGVVGEALIGGGAFGQMLPDPDADLAWCRLHNDWLADTYRDELHRFAPGIRLPLHDLKKAAEEVARCASKGLGPVLLPEVVPGRPYCTPEWEPVWEAADAYRVPVFLHVTGALGQPSLMGGAPPSATHVPGSAETAFAAVSAAAMITVGWFVNSGILERHPNLTIVTVECNAAWLAYAMQQWDHSIHSRYSEVAARMGSLDSDLEAPPSYYVRRQVKAQFMWDPAAVTLRHEIGLNVLMWGNDYPHMEGAFPDSDRWIDKLFAGVPENEVMQIVHDNAADLLGFTV
jgi:predicted TIM-barrel fold metal-dependent hydrolase